jgi:hypothetical protein
MLEVRPEMAMNNESGAKRRQRAFAEHIEIAYPARKSAFGWPGEANARFIVRKLITSACP